MRKPLVSLVALVSWYASFATLQAPEALAFTCPDVTDHFAVGGQDSPAGYANKANVLVNDFALHQTDTWRAVGVYQNDDNLVEQGWFVSEDYDQNAHPYRSWVDNGILGTGNWALINVPQGTSSYVEFGVKDIDDDNMYEFIYNGGTLGDPKHVSISAGSAFGLSESESWCSSDSLKARFTALRAVHSQGGGWQVYHSLNFYINTSYLRQYTYANETISIYHVCKPSACSF